MNTVNNALAEVSLSREYFLILREGLLRQVDALERILEISPRTSELRRLLKENNAFDNNSYRKHENEKQEKPPPPD